MRRKVSSLQFRLTAGFAIVLALAITGVSAYSAITTRHQTQLFAAQVEAARTERAELLVQNAYEGGEQWAGVQLAVAQVGGLFGWRVVVTNADGYVVADSHEIVSIQQPVLEHFDTSRFKTRSILRRPIIIGNRVVGEMLMDPSSEYDRPALSISKYGADLFASFGVSLGDRTDIRPSTLDLYPRSSRQPRPTATFVPGTVPSTVAAVDDAFDELLIEPPLTDLEASFRRSLVVAGSAAMVAGLLLVTLFTRQALSPVRTLTVAARRLGAGDLSYRVPETRSDEIGELASTFNEMATDLESAAAQRRRMTADIAHELRTPLTNIQGYLEAIKDGVVAPDTETIDNLHTQTVHLSHLVDDLRLLSIAEAGALRLEIQPDSLESVVRESVASFGPRAAELGVSVELRFDAGLPLVRIDRTRMRQIIVNIIENALHYTASGGRIEIAARHEGGVVTLTISDTGRGIPAAELPKIFEEFYRVDPSRARATGGAGLGLTIVKRLVEAHGGTIAVESVPGEGTMFHITLPTG